MVIMGTTLCRGHSEIMGLMLLSLQLLMTVMIKSNENYDNDEDDSDDYNDEEDDGGGDLDGNGEKQARQTDRFIDRLTVR